MTGYRVERLGWTDLDHGSMELPGAVMPIRSGFGSGLSRQAGDPAGVVWAVADRGPNLKPKTLAERYGLDIDGGRSAKVMPRPELGPAIARLRVDQSSVELLHSFPIRTADGSSASGLPPPAGGHAECEPALDLGGKLLTPDPSGLDSEGIAALRDGGFWVSDEYGPSLVRLDGNGRMIHRLVPEGLSLGPTSEPSLPAIAAARQLNRGFEAVAASTDEQSLVVAFQSPLAHPDLAAHEQARHVRIWAIDAATGSVTSQYLYPLDPPESFRRDTARGPFARADVKLSEICLLADDELLVLERGSETAKLYRTRLAPDQALPPEHLDVDTRPTVEELSPGDMPLPVLAKQLLFSTDDAPEVAADLEGMALLSPSELLLVSDNDFGVEGGETSFWRISFDRPLFKCNQAPPRT
jgi:hypothetical protein